MHKCPCRHKASACAHARTHTHTQSCTYPSWIAPYPGVTMAASSCPMARCASSTMLCKSGPCCQKKKRKKRERERNKFTLHCIKQRLDMHHVSHMRMQVSFSLYIQYLLKCSCLNDSKVFDENCTVVMLTKITIQTVLLKLTV